MAVKSFSLFASRSAGVTLSNIAVVTRVKWSSLRMIVSSCPVTRAIRSWWSFNDGLYDVPGCGTGIALEVKWVRLNGMNSGTQIDRHPTATHFNWLLLWNADLGTPATGVPVLHRLCSVTCRSIHSPLNSLRWSFSEPIVQTSLLNRSPFRAIFASLSA